VNLPFPQEQTTRGQEVVGCSQCGASLADDAACDTLFHEIGMKLQTIGGFG
jgi:hypothetical protein